MILNDEQRRKRAEKVLETTRRLITERGIENLNMRDLAVEARVSVPTLYKLCGDKEQIISQAMRDHMGSMMQEFAGNASRPGAERFLALLELSVKAILELGNYSREVVGHLFENKMKDLASEQFVDHWNQYIVTALTEMKTTGQMEAWADPQVLSGHVTIHATMCCFGWYGGYIAEKSLAACFVYGSTLIVLGPAKGAARKLLEKRVQELQPLAVASKLKRDERQVSNR